MALSLFSTYYFLTFFFSFLFHFFLADTAVFITTLFFMVFDGFYKYTDRGR